MHEIQQLRLLVQSSVILGERTEGGFEYVLYNINGLYVEEARSLNDESLYYYTCIEDTDLLLPYTEEIEIVFL
ncbi:MAG: hypothetical protein KF862_15550 [Chitinophagaceae bacterium]|nr:hypothetical protein [Chitinophagaceae bacterium]